jgi:Interferon-induced transmembrane protein
MSSIPPPPPPPPPPPMYSGGGGPAPQSVPNYLVQAILCTLFCCLPAGVVAIVFAAQVNGKLAAGDYAGAVSASNNAKTWTWVSFGIGLAIGLLYAILIIIGASSS